MLMMMARKHLKAILPKKAWKALRRFYFLPRRCRQWMITTILAFRAGTPTVTPQTKICAYPFARMEVGTVEWFSPCCSAWFEKEYFDLEPGADCWNGPQAKELRRRILNGDYSLCKTDECHAPLIPLETLMEKPNTNAETPITPQNLKAMMKGITELPEGPSSLVLSVDKRCNLKCPTCRDHLINSLSEDETEMVNREIQYVLDNRQSVQVIKMSGNGEVFFSPDQRDLLKKCSHDTFPRLNYVSIISNGLLLNQKTLDELRPGSDFIKQIAISLDAGTEDVYRKVRRGNWKTLLQNLQWVGEQRQAGRFNWLSFLFVVRLENFHTIPQVVELGHRYSMDQIRFLPFNIWPNTHSDLETHYHDQAIHLPSHPRFLELVDLAEQYRNDKKVLFGMELHPGLEYKESGINRLTREHKMGIR